MTQSKQQRCNHCMTVQDEANYECEKCGKDDALMYPFSLTKGEVKAVNSHDDLVRLAELALDYIDGDEYIKAVELIAKAKGEA